MDFLQREPSSQSNRPSTGSGDGCSQSDSRLPLDTPALFGLTSPHLEFPAIETVSTTDELNGIWLTAPSDVPLLRTATQRPEFQVACLALEGDRSTRADEWASLAAGLAQQVFLRREWFVGDVVTTAPLSYRVVQELQRATGISPELASDIHRSMQEWVSAFAVVSGVSRARLILISERGPRRLELEGGQGPSSFHTDDSGLRLVAPILGPQTIFLISGRGERAVRLLPSPERESLLSDRSPFDLDRAVRASYTRLFAPIPHPSQELIRCAPDRFGILFPGTLSYAERPLIHAAPHPRCGADATTWARLFLTVDPS